LLIKLKHSDRDNYHQLLLEKLTLKQQLNLKRPIVDTNNRLNKIFPSFIPFSSEFSPRDQLINIFHSCFSFHFLNKNSEESKKLYIQKLDELVFQTSVNSKMAVVVSDASIKNQVAILIAHFHVFNNLIIKTFHHVVNVTTTKAELFAIRCSINQAIQIMDIHCIIVIIFRKHREFF